MLSPDRIIDTQEQQLNRILRPIDLFRVFDYNTHVNAMTSTQPRQTILCEPQKTTGVACFAGGVAHDLNNTVTVTTGLAGTSLVVVLLPGEAAGEAANA